MTRDEFKKLVTDYGNACFDCGALRPYLPLSDKAQELREQLWRVFDELTND